MPSFRGRTWARCCKSNCLTAPMALVTIAIVLAAMWGPVRALARRTPALLTLAVGAASMLFYSVAWNPDLGPRNDWDLLGLPALPLTLLAVYLLLQLADWRLRRIALAAYRHSRRCILVRGYWCMCWGFAIDQGCIAEWWRNCGIINDTANQLILDDKYRIN